MQFLLRKIVHLLCVLFIIATLTFVLMKSLPGDPFQQEKALPKETHEALKKHYGLDRPIAEQYVQFLKSAVFFDFGPSFIYQERTVNQIIREGFPFSAILGLEALLIAIPLGIGLGMTSALKKNQKIDKASIIFSVMGISIPSFIFATLLQYVFAVKWEIFPIARWGGIAHTILPALSLAILPAAFISRLMRAKASEELQSDYVKTARSKGLPELYILWRHVFPNAVTPVLSYLGQLIANILTGSFIVEKIYGIPGLGQWFVNSILNRDYTLIMGITIFYSIIMLGSIFLVEALCLFIDPRRREEIG